LTDIFGQHDNREEDFGSGFRSRGRGGAFGRGGRGGGIRRDWGANAPSWQRSVGMLCENLNIK